MIPPAPGETLLTCPFCGSTPVSNDFYVWCRQCSPLVQRPRKDWNWRVETVESRRLAGEVEEQKRIAANEKALADAYARSVLGDQPDHITLFRDYQQRAEQLAGEVAQLQQQVHRLKRAISPSRAGVAPWDGMPDLAYFVGVANRLREREPTIETRSEVVDHDEGDAATLRGYINTYGETPSMTASSREYWKARAEAAEGEIARLRQQLVEAEIVRLADSRHAAIICQELNAEVARLREQIQGATNG